jgi:hypothetical protein
VFLHETGCAAHGGLRPGGIAAQALRAQMLAGILAPDLSAERVTGR